MYKLYNKYKIIKIKYFYKILFFTILLFTFISCTSTKFVEIPVDKVKIEYKDRIQIDTLIKNDSIIIKNKDDTIYIEKYKYLYRVKEKRDTINIVDTITVVEKVEVIKGINKLNGIQKLLIGLGGAVVILCLIKLILFIKKWI